MVEFGKRRGLRGPRIRAAAHSGNRRMVDALVGTSGDGGMVPQMMADAFRSGPEGALEVEDFFEELLKRDRAKGKRVLARTRKLLPKEEEQRLRNKSGAALVPVQKPRRFPVGVTPIIPEQDRRSRLDSDDPTLLAASEVARPKVKPRVPERVEGSARNSATAETLPRPRVKPTAPARAPTLAELVEELEELSQKVEEAPAEFRRTMISEAKAKAISETRWDDDLLENIVKREAARQGYFAVGKPLDEEGDRALGRYQLVREARQDVGLQDAQGRWTGKWGINSAEEFLNNPVAQERAMDIFLQRVEEQLKAPRNRSWETIGTKVKGVLAPFEVTEAGLLAASHRRGAGMVAQYVRDMAANGWRSDEDRWRGKNRLRQFSELEKRLREFEKIKARRGTGK